ncbi:MAG TPA: TetR family transcriptional regulator [Alphaproteobacteria bacterium]|nr:TetR family transcriptional regulator [Alphaproteobacteria bacterium]
MPQTKRKTAAVGLVAPAKAAKPRARNRLNREAIVAEAVAMVSEGALEALTLRGLAERLGTSPMSLYTYFRSRDALLNALADHVFALFEVPPSAGTWQDDVRNWLHATYNHFLQHPIAPKVIVWDGHVCPAWLKTWFPIARLLKEQGLEGQRLAFAMSWFTTAAMGFITSRIDSPAKHKLSMIAHIEGLDETDERLAVELWLHFQNVDQKAALEFGFDVLVRGLEAIIRGESPWLPNSFIA